MSIEYTVTTRQRRYFVAVDGKFVEGLNFPTPDDALAWVRAHARASGATNAGITEAFSRNRQWTQGPRGGWRSWRP